MGYLLYVSRDAENFQFYLWFQDYSRRFFASSRTEQALSPLWNDDSAQAVGHDSCPRLPHIKSSRSTEFKVDFDSNEIFPQPITDQQSFVSGSAVSSPAHSVEVVNAQTGLNWQPCGSSTPRLIYQDIDDRSHNPAFSLRNQQNHLPLPESRLTPRAQSLPERPYSMRKYFLATVLESNC